MGYENSVFGCDILMSHDEVGEWVVAKVKYKPFPVDVSKYSGDLYDERSGEFVLDPEYENMPEVEEQYSKSIHLAYRLAIKQKIGVKFNRSILDVDDKYYYFDSGYDMMELVKALHLRGVQN